ncbi:MAG: hypothetical protein HYZ14_06315 [Bacteroidetes bacterium]|nr:hypothetical protein [Bacteroidota bacterium]
MMKRLYLLLAGLGLTCATLFAAVEPVNNRVQGTNLYSLVASGTHDLADNKFWMVEAGIWQSHFDIQSVKNKIIFGIDESDMTYQASTYSYRIKFDVSYKELVNGVLTTKTFNDIYLDVHYDPARGNTYKDRGVFAFTGGLDVKIDVELIEVESAIGSGSWSTAGSIPNALFLETEIVTERFYNFDQTIVPSTSISVSTSGDEVIVSWPFMDGAEEYDLEWAWVSRYDVNATTGALELLGASAVSYNFNENATRVRIQGQNSFAIPLIYGDGFIVVRYRGVGRGGANYTIPLEGAWSSDGTTAGAAGTVSAYPNYFSVSAHESNGINYGAGISFIENGVNSVGVTYMDGVLKPRQSQSKLNGQDKIIVGSTIYDHHGRPAIGVMSSPVDQSTLGYVENLNMYKNGVNPAVPYEKQHFDLDQTLVCGSMNPAPPMDDVSSEGAANYYSPENPDQEGYNAYLPDAEGYPFVQVQYTPDPTGRIKKVGGVGADHQLGATLSGANDPHYTEYFYTTPDDEELWALFGNDAARVVNYTKVITKDVHGQISVALIDGMGRTVATYMEGPAPAGLDEIEGNTGLTATGKDFTLYNQNFENGVLQVETPIVVTDPSVVYTFNYDFTGATFNECLPANICYDCVYELDITIIPAELTACDITDGASPSPTTISDADGVVHMSFDVGSITTFDTDCDTPLQFSTAFPNDDQFTVQFGAAGEYYIIKTLRVSDAPVEYYWEQYIAQDTCLLTYDDFLQNSLAQVDWTQCDEYDPCEFTFLLEYGTVSVWLTNNPTQDSTSYNALKADYLADCGTLNSCDAILPLLLQDMSPGGQYGSTTTTDALSVYNTSNSLGGDWLDVTYHNEDGSISYVDSDGDLVEDDLPTTLTITEFFAAWQPSWAMDLIQFHPEHCYYDFCVDYPGIADYEQDLFDLDTYDAACSSGYINPAEAAGYFDLAACTTNVEDPILGTLYDNLSTADKAAVDAIMNADYDTYSIYQMAVAMSGDDPGSVTFGTGCNENKHWENFRILYMSKRFQVIEIIKADYVADNCTNATCVGNPAPACSTSVFNESSKRYFNYESAMGYDLSYLNTTDWAAEGDTAAMDIDTMCFTMCEDQALTWMQQLAGCDSLLTGSETWASGQATYDSVYYHLIQVCAGGCAGGCFNLTQENVNVTTDTTHHVFASFEDVIVYWLGEQTLYCSNLLITNPLPGACDGTIEDYLNECVCEMLLATDGLAEFESLYGYSPADYDEEKCYCDTYDANNDLDIAGSEITALNAAEIITTTQYVCPVTCIDCAEMDDIKTDFHTAYGIEYYENTSLFTSYVNDQANTSFTYEELLGLIDNCIAVNTSAATPIYNMIGQKAYDIRAMLEKLNEADLTTSDTYTHTQLPEYFYSGLYSCTDQATASYSYSPSISTDILSFTTMGTGCTGTCSLSVDIVGSLPGVYANPTEYFQNILSFDQVFITQGDILSTSTDNIFHISVTLDDLAGGTLTGDLKITSCYDIVSYLEDPITRELTFNLCPELPVVEGDPCMENLIALAELDAQAQYDAYLDAQHDLFVENYKETCALVTNETFNMTYQANRYHYTLLYYDQSGNLVRTVSPKGVTPLTGTPLANAIAFANGTGTAVYPSHTYNTYYKHNSLNQVVEVTTPDGGTSHYWYDNIGRLVVSQNARQEDFQTGLMTNSPGTGTAVPAYSYTRYDALGRVYEVGEIIHDDDMTNTIAKNPTSLLNWLNEDVAVSTQNVVRNNITLIYYDDAYSQAAADEFAMADGDLTTLAGYGHTRNRITATAVIEAYVEHTAGTWIYPAPDYINHYRYDLHGNVQSYLQEITDLAAGSSSAAETYRRTDYNYDLISGNPNYIYYQKGKPDQYIHHYMYDADNRLKEVFTSDDGQIWDRDVNYEYREDGYLARTELGEMKVQGMDYAYTLHGWIKTLNSGVLNADFDMGKDGDLSNNAQYDVYEANIHDLHARDVLSYTVGYYNGDYTQISSGTGYSNMPVAVAGALATDIDELFNGNITSYVAGTTDETGARLNPLATAYHYDQLHRFKESHVFTYTDIISSNSTLNAVRANTTGPGGLGDYEMHVDYDKNGNITGLDRQAQGATNDMDEFTYNYLSNTNKLDYVTDAETGTGSSGYGDIQHGQATGNYLYHDDGSLKKDVDEEIEYIDWYPSGLVKRIYRTATSTLSDLYFEYDPTGNRTLKVEMTRTGTTLNAAENWLYTYYGADANGITMAVYDYNPDDTNPDVLTKNETMLYGGSRLGMETTAEIVNTAVDYLADCNNDGLASGVIQLGAFTPTTGVVVEILLDGDLLADITWNTANTIESHGEALVAEINANALGYYAEMIDMGSYVYIRLKETTSGSLLEKDFTVELDNTSTPSYIKRQPGIGDCYESRILGKKFYELNNYLGNVMEVIADRKVAHNNAGTIDYFEADVISYADYYPGGMEMPGRSGSIQDYRFAYSGKEKMDELSGSGNSYDFGARMYNPRLLRWMSADPKEIDFPHISTYSFCFNNPIYFQDPDGKAPEPPIIWVKNEKGSKNIYTFATGFKYQKGDNYFDVFAHSTRKKIIAYNSSGTKVIVKTPEQFVALMCEVSPEFAAAMERGDLITVKLHACNTGADDDDKGGYYSNPIGQQISEAYPNIVVIAPDGKVVTAGGKDPNGTEESTGNAHEKGIYDKDDKTPDSNDGKGSYRVFFKGKEISKDDSVGLPDNTNPANSSNKNKEPKGDKKDTNAGKGSKTKKSGGWKFGKIFKKWGGTKAKF